MSPKSNLPSKHPFKRPSSQRLHHHALQSYIKPPITTRALACFTILLCTAYPVHSSPAKDRKRATRANQGRSAPLSASPDKHTFDNLDEADIPPTLPDLPKALRNPFQPPLENIKDPLPSEEDPLVHFDLSQLRLTAIIRDQEGNLKGSIETPTGRGFIVTQGSRVGSKGGLVKEISRARLLIEEPADSSADHPRKVTELSIRGDREDWQTRHALRINRNE